MTDFNHEAIQKQLRELLWRLDLCNCGHGVAWKMMLQFLQRAADQNLTFYDSMPGTDSEVVEFVAQLLDALRLVEHGSGVGCAWPTPDGEVLLDFLSGYGVVPDAWPEWATVEEE